MKSVEFVRFIRCVVQEDVGLRKRAADEVTDWVSAYSEAEAVTLATLLSATAALETDVSALEAQLHAILELTSTGHVRVEHLGHLREIDRSTLPASLGEFVTDLLDEDAVPGVDLDSIEELCSVATPGPWFVRGLDDDHAMNLVAVSTVEGAGHGERWPGFDHKDLIAATLVQHPRYVDCVDGRWDENAAFIAMAREAVPSLVAEVKRLRRLLAAAESHH
ncbi:hypothetical protein [Streptomyces sp. MMBL 11-3]|uniref:hypothetical protein n=1 Tax=Streptomyces sp. MMBL 11-3 TaxID=3382639 RepID=UPI0039B5A8DE